MAFTRDAIESILGPVDNQLATEIAATGASEAEVARALTGVNADDALLDEGQPISSGRVAEVITILESVGADDVNNA